MTRIILWLSIVLSMQVVAQTNKGPAYPLITHDPYFSIWSNTDVLTKSPTHHWTGTDHSLIDMIKVDDDVYSFLGDQSFSYQSLLPASDEEGFEAKFTENEPATDWMQPGFDDSAWKNGLSPFGGNQRTSKTLWKSRFYQKKITAMVPSIP